MKTNDVNVNLNLDLQAYADGELDDLTALRRVELDRLLATDAAAKAYVDGVRSLSAVVRGHEPVYAVPATREFYWSQIQRRMEAADQMTDRQAIQSTAPAKIHWLRWLVPVLGAAAVVVSISWSRGRLSGVSLADGGRSESGSDGSEAMVFRSESDGVTIHWLN